MPVRDSSNRIISERGIYGPNDEIRLVESAFTMDFGSIVTRRDQTQEISKPTIKTNTKQVTFWATPEISESKSINYVEESDIRAPASITYYMGTTSRNFNITGYLISRTPDEAQENFEYIKLLKAWTYPDWKAVDSTVRDRMVQNSSASVSGEQPDGETPNIRGKDTNIAPPALLKLWGLAYKARGLEPGNPESANYQYDGHFKGIPVVITNLNIEYPRDVDYIRSSSGVPMPIIQNVSISLKEIRAMDELFQFSLDDYKKGLVTW